MQGIKPSDADALLNTTDADADLSTSLEWTSGDRTKQARTIQQSKPTRTVVDLFAGCGGTSCGFRAAGFEPVCAVDFEPNAMVTYKANFPSAKVITGDIATQGVQDLLVEKYTGVDCVIMCPPCQGLSNQNQDKNKRNDPRNQGIFFTWGTILGRRFKRGTIVQIAACP